MHALGVPEKMGSVPNFRKRIIVNGIVQGVGFRPAVFKIARKNNLAGSVRNTSKGVVIEIEGQLNGLKKFIEDLKQEKPPQSRIDTIKIDNISPKNQKEFVILKSERLEISSSIIPVDMALCDDCRREIHDKADRRYGYPFTNCTNCGPRFTIVKKIPYDRPFTTMKKFKMCPDCRKEYENPLDRRFHAQPNACPVCGPSVRAVYKGKIFKGAPVFEFLADMLIKGRIAAVQSLGGFHIACDSLNKETVVRLRKLKNRPHKPFAVMFKNVDEVKKHCFLTDFEKEILCSVRAPVLMLKKRKKNSFAPASPGLDTIGVMLPYTPLHEVLFHALFKKSFYNPLIMTSGNRRDEPIARTHEEAEENLSELVDLIVYHDRDIHNRIDDSVGFAIRNEFFPIRRARGFVPESVTLPVQSEKAVLGCGADLKNTFCLVRGSEAFLSQHIGDLSESENQGFYLETLKNMEFLLDVRPQIIAHDLHPDYVSTSLGKSIKGSHVQVQHHLAHVLSVMAENKLAEPVIGVALDGTGYGTDGNIWGCEFFKITENKWERIGHLKYFPLPGGDKAVFEIWRSAYSLVKSINDAAVRKKAYKLFDCVKEIKVLDRMIETGINSPLTSSMGRLFDAVSFLAGLRKEATYEAHGPMELESLCAGMPKDFYRFEIFTPWNAASLHPDVLSGYSTGFTENNMFIIDPAKVICSILLETGRDRAKIISEKFHLGIAHMINNMVLKINQTTNIKKIVLSGGVFQNRTVLKWTTHILHENSFEVFTNKKVPANDGGISLGQVYYVISGLHKNQ